MDNLIINQLGIVSFAKNCNDNDIDLFDISKHGIVQVYENENQPVLFLKEVDYFDFETLKQIAEIHKICWNFQKVLFLYVYTKTEIRIYNCSEKPFGFDKGIKENEFQKKLKELELYSCKETDKEKLKNLNVLFSRIAIDTGFIWSSIEANDIKKKINLERRVDKFLIQSLINVSRELEKQGLKDKNIVHKLVMRSLFLLYLEDKGATTKEFYSTFLNNADSYFKILNSVETTYALFERLSNDFNGSLFTIDENELKIVKPEHLDLIKKCFINGFKDASQVILFEDWKLFDFSIIRIELLSEIYENFLSELDKKEKKNTGTFYTPPALVELILNEKLPIKKEEINYNVKTLDPSCGSGIFLVQSFKRLVKRYENKHKTKLNDFDVLVKILKTNIFGIEIDSKSIKVAAFSLYLALLDNLDPKTGWWNGTIVFPYLISDPEDKTLKQQGNNLFKRDTISDLSNDKILQDFDLIIGNPPFGELLSEKKDVEDIQKNIRAYCDKEKFAKEMVLPFLHKATSLSPKGKIALIFNTKVLTNNEGPYQNFRKWLFNENYVEKIYNFSILRKAPKFSGGQLFGSAVGPISIVFYQNKNPEIQKDTITYYAPKTYIKNDVLEGIVIDSSDEKHLPRIECKKKDSKIWKIAMWGSYLDFELIERINKKYESLKDHFNNNKILFKTGLNSDSEHPDFIPEKIINAKKISRYYTLNNSENISENNSRYYRKINSKLFKPPFIILKRFQKDKELVASYIDYDAFCTTTGMIVNENLDTLDKKNLVGLINSKFSRYYLFMITSSWGIEREQINSDEFDELPFLFKKEDKKIANILSEIISIKKSNELDQDISHLEKEIDEIIYNDILKLTKDERIIIQDTLNYGLDLFEKQEKSKAVFPVVNSEDYTNRLTKELNDWLDDVNLKVSTTIYDISRNCPLYLVKISFGSVQEPIFKSKENIYEELKKIDKNLWKEEGQNLYFRKKINYYDGNDVYIIKPNQRRFWSQTVAMEDSKSLLVEILNMKE
jgi:type I restriction-modification system DNA methylase subunit